MDTAKDQFVLIGRMGVVAAGAAGFLDRIISMGFFKRTGGAVMAGKTELLAVKGKQPLVVRTVRQMANLATIFGQRGMDILPFEFLPVMALVAKFVALDL